MNNFCVLIHASTLRFFQQLDCLVSSLATTVVWWSNIAVCDGGFIQEEGCNASILWSTYHPVAWLCEAIEPPEHYTCMTLLLCLDSPYHFPNLCQLAA